MSLFFSFLFLSENVTFINQVSDFHYVRIYEKYINFFIYFIIMLIPNILYLWVDCNQINQGDLITILVFRHYPINRDLCIVDKSS
jgi:hypothetical protein